MSEGRQRKSIQKNQHFVNSIVESLSSLHLQQNATNQKSPVESNTSGDNNQSTLYRSSTDAVSSRVVATTTTTSSSEIAIETRQRPASRCLPKGSRYCHFLLEQVTSKNYKQTLHELIKFISSQPQQISLHQTLLQPLLLAAGSSKTELKVKLAREVLPIQIDHLCRTHRLPSVFCRTLESLERSGYDVESLLQILLASKEGILSAEKELEVVSALLRGSLSLNNSSVFEFLVNKLQELSETNTSIESIVFSLEANKTVSSFHHKLSHIKNLTRRLPLMDSSGNSTPIPMVFSLWEQITNVLSDLGPACTSSPTTLRDTIKEVTNSLLLSSPDNSGGINRMEEGSMARLLLFFANKAGMTDKGNLSADLVSTLLPGSLTESKGGWNMDTVKTVIQEDYKHLDWSLVALRLDFDSFHITSSTTLEYLLQLYRAGAHATLPLSSILAQWKHSSGQLTLLSHLLLAPPSIFTFEVSEAEAADAKTAGDRCSNRGWACTSLLQKLLQMSDIPALSRPVRDLFVMGLRTCPEVLLCSLVRLQLQVGNTNRASHGLSLKGELMRELIPRFFKPMAPSAMDTRAAIQRLWEISPTTVGAACEEAWRSTVNDSTLNRLATVLHIVGIVRILPESVGTIVNGAKDFEFSIAIAFVMADNKMLSHLSAWLKDRCSAGGTVFIVSLVRYLKATCSMVHPRTNESKTLLTIENLNESLMFLKNFDQSVLNQPIPIGDGPPQTLSAHISSLMEICQKNHPELMAELAPAPPAPTQPPVPSSNNPDDIEEMANMYFQKIYTSESSVAEVVDMLKQFKLSGNAKENDIFACMIHNLFDEYRFFSKYPEKELRITGILFGTLIQEQLVTSITLGIALRYVLEALRKPPGKDTTSRDGKMFRFGMFALQQFKGRLHEWPQYCSHVVQIEHLKQGYQDLVQEIEVAMTESQRDTTTTPEPPREDDRSTLTSGPPRGAPPDIPAPVRPLVLAAPTPVLAVRKPQPKFGPKLGRAVNPPTEAPNHDTPPDRILDEVCRLFNNVSPSNVEQKAKELKDLLEPQYFGWLGHYLVVKRISSQPNFHSLYLAFLDQLGDYGKGLAEAILVSVYLNVGNLLRSQKITTSSHERSLLKNLGSWLGQTTLARNRPILQIMLDCKELLFQGYENGMLIAVTPFVAKILEGAKNSIVFRPPNPWLMGLLSVFRSLYNVADLKMNFKFEVEVLCKNLGLTLDDIPIRNDDLAKRLPPVKEQNPDFTTKSSMVAPAAPAAPASPKSTERPLTPAPPEGQTVIPNLAAYVTINPSLSVLFQNNPTIAANLKRSVPIAVDRAIREIIQPVVERSVTIASITTKIIVTKDFCMEGDDTKMSKAAQLMVSNLAGSLALVTCREPLRASISTHLRQLLTTPNLTDAEATAVEQCVAICATDNLELGCVLIEKAATEKAVTDMEKTLAPAFQDRRNHKETTPAGTPYFDRAVLSAGRYPSGLPDAVRPPTGGLRPDQLLVYDAFQRLPRPPMPGAAAKGTARKGAVGLEALTAVAAKLDAAVSHLLSQVGGRAHEITLAMIPPDHEIRQLILAVRRVGGGRPLSSTEADAVMMFAQGLFKRLYDMTLNEPLRLESLIMVLESLNAFCPQLGQDLGTWSTYAPIETEAQRKLHRTILLLLLRSHLIPVNEIDQYIARNMDNGRNMTWVEFGFLFIRTAVLERIIEGREMTLVLEALGNVPTNTSHGLKIRRLLDELRNESDSTKRQMTYQQSSSISPASLNNLAEGTKKAVEAIEIISRNDPPGMRQQVTFLLDSWIRVHNEAPGSEKALAQYLQLLQQHGVGKADEITERFFRISTELVVEACLKTLDEKKTLNYAVVDAYAKLASLLIRYMNSGGSTDQIAAQRVSLLNKLLGTTVRTLMSNYERCKNGGIVPLHWDQRPWFRLLLNLICDLNAPSPILDPISFGILSVFGSAFHVLQPLVVPGFAFAWLELISHRMFLSNILLLKNQKGWGVAHQLLIDLFLFLEPHLRKTELTDAIKHLYKGTLRVLLVLLHDFPSFLAGYHLSFCNVIPENCVQLRNLILSAFPRGMVLPDPFTPNLKIDRLPEIGQSPIIMSNLSGPLQGFRAELDTYLKTRQPANFVTNLLPRLYKDGSNDISPPKINSLVLFVGIQAIKRLQNSQMAPQIAHTPEMEILQKLMDFDDRGRYISLNAIANQLRYPSSHTHYFSCVMLFLFSEAKDDGVKEQVTRVLLERLIVHRPHPWGLLITFIELIKNQRYEFWSHSFTRCATEIEKVFQSVARSCMTPESLKTVTAGSGDNQ